MGYVSVLKGWGDSVNRTKSETVASADGSKKRLIGRKLPQIAEEEEEAGVREKKSAIATDKNGGIENL